MKFCTNCGAANEDSQIICTECGMLLPETAPGGRKKGIPKLALGIGAGVLALGLAIGGIAWGVSLLGGNDEEDAYDKTMGQFAEMGEDKTRLQQFLDQTGSLLTGGEYTLGATWENENASVQWDMDYSRDAKQLNGGIYYSNTAKGSELELNYSASDEEVQLALPQKTANIYGFNIPEFEKKYRNSLVLSLLPISLPEELDLDFFVQPKGDNLLENLAGGGYDMLLSAIEVEELGERNLTVAGETQTCQAYRVTWSGEDDSGSFDFLPSVTDLLDAILPDVEPDCLFYINAEGCLIGADFVSKGSQYLFVLEGKENLWDKFSLTKNSLHDDPVVYSGAMVEDGEKLRLYLEGEAGEVWSFDYDDSTGAFTMNTAQTGQILHGEVLMSQEETALRMDWALANSGEQELVLTVTDLQQQPEPLTKGYTDLLDMSLTDWQRLMLELGVKFP